MLVIEHIKCLKRNFSKLIYLDLKVFNDIMSEQITHYYDIPEILNFEKLINR